MPYQPPRSWIENFAERFGWISNLSRRGGSVTLPQHPPLSRFPRPDEWDDFVERDARAWPRTSVERHYRLVPTTCFNCESACGLLAYVDRETGSIRKFEGNPVHPGSRGKNCAKGPATINQVNDPDRILKPLKRVGQRGEGQWREVSWDEVLRDVGGRIRAALVENRRDEVVYHVGRPGAEGSVDRVLRAWGVDGHNSHTNICSGGARLGYALWSGYDRPTPDYANARFILALNAHLESGHYFNPHAQRIIEGLSSGAAMAVVDPRLSNTSSHAKYWLPIRPGTEAALILAFAKVLLDDDLVDRAYIEKWVNWRESLEALGAQEGAAAEKDGAAASVPTCSVAHLPGMSVDDFLAKLKQLYRDFTPEFAEKECGIPAKTIVEVARRIGQAGSRFCSHTWRGAASAHLGGWQVSRCLMLLHALTGSYGTEGGCLPSAWSKYKANLIDVPPPQNHWNELNWPREYPLAHYEMSQLLPHFLKDGRGKIDVYFTRVFNPVWTYPDGFTWIEALRDESKIGLHVALTPIWNETAFFADYVLPMGHGPERHDLNTYETHSGTWIAFRQPVKKAVAIAEGRAVRDSRDVNPGEVWEEDEFWIALTWAVDPDGALGIRRYMESRKTPGQRLTTDEYYAHAFERVPGLPEAAAKENLTPLEYMRKFGAFEVKKREYRRNERRLSDAELEGATIDGLTGLVRKGASPVGLAVADAKSPGGVAAVEGFATPSRRLEFFSRTMAGWGWAECAVPWYIPSHLYETPGVPGAVPRGGTGTRERGNLGREESETHPSASPPSHLPTAATAAALPEGEFVLLPTFRLPTLIHTRSGAAKWLNEIAQQNPIWIHTSDARKLGVRTGDLVRVSTRIGYFVDKAWVTEGVRPGVAACSHHLGRWRRPTDPPASRWSGNVVKIEESGGVWTMRRMQGPGPFDSPDPDSRRVWWREGGVHQNITFPVQPDPISGMHCWHQRVRVERAHAGDALGDIAVDTNKSMAVYREWLRRTRWPVGPAPVPGDSGSAPGGATRAKRLRRPLWLNRPLKPAEPAYWIDAD